MHKKRPKTRQFINSRISRFQQFNPNAHVQTFELPADERIVATFKKTFPFYWHERASAVRGSEEDGLSIASHTVLDGCVLLTTAGLYECRPRYSGGGLRDCFRDLLV